MKFGLRIRFTDVLVDGSLHNEYVNGKRSGYGFDIRLGYYRGHFLSDIEELNLLVDGEPVPRQEVRFGLNGKEFSVEELRDAYNEFWRLLDAASITVRKAGGLSAGAHQVKLDMWLRIPYLPLPGGENDHAYMPLDNCEEKAMLLVEA